MRTVRFISALLVSMVCVLFYVDLVKLIYDCGYQVFMTRVEEAPIISSYLLDWAGASQAYGWRWGLLIVFVILTVVWRGPKVLVRLPIHGVMAICMIVLTPLTIIFSLYVSLPSNSFYLALIFALAVLGWLFSGLAFLVQVACDQFGVSPDN